MRGVSILIPCHNHGHLLGEAVDSVLSQTAVAEGLAIQIIIVDDGSTDDSFAAAREWQQREPSRIEVIQQTQSGQAVARETALRRARHEYIVMLDADDLLEPNMLAKATASLERTPEAAAVIGQAFMVASDSRRIMREFDQDKIRGWPEILAYNPYGALAACMVRTAAVRKVGGLAVAGAAGCEDWDLWVRLARSRHEVVINPGRWARYRQSISNYSRNPLRMLEAELNLINHARDLDARLETCEVVLPTIDVYQHANYAHGRIFHALGLALGSEDRFNSQATYRHILSPLNSDVFDAGFYCRLGAWGLRFACDGWQASQVETPGQLNAAADDTTMTKNILATRLHILRPILRERLSHAGFNPEGMEAFINKFFNSLLARRPSLARRIYQKIFSRGFSALSR